MARGVNKVILVGNVGADIELRHMPSGGAVCEVSVATTEQWNDKDGVKQEKTEWHRVSCFNRQAEVAHEFLRKGSQVYFEGSIRTDKYKDAKTGEDKYSTKIIARDMQLLGGRSDTSGGNNATGGGSAPQVGGAPAQSTGGGSSGSAEFEDDIPFVPFMHKSFA